MRLFFAAAEAQTYHRRVVKLRFFSPCFEAGRSCGKGAAMYQTVQSGPGALPCADDILYLRHDFHIGRDSQIYHSVLMDSYRTGEECAACMNLSGVKSAAFLGFEKTDPVLMN